MPIAPVTFSDASGGIADLYIGTDTTRSQKLVNMLIDETKKPYVRDGTSIYGTRLPFASGSSKPSGIYLGAQPYTHPLVIVGPHAYTANESGSWTEISGWATTALNGKVDPVVESALIWKRQLVYGAPVTGLIPSIIYCTNYTQPASSANTAAYKALTLGMPALASSPTIHFDDSDAFQAAYAFFYKYTFIDYTGTVFAFFGNPSLPGFVSGSVNDAGGPSATSISISAIPALANSGSSNYDVSTSATTNSVYTLGSKTVTVTSATGIVKGAQLIAPGYVTNGSVVTGISGTTITMSLPAIATGSSISTTYSTLTVQICRTINGGSVLFFLAALPNGTTSYADAIADTDLQLQAPIYTSGGALGYDQPPTNVLALTQTNDTFWFATNTTLAQSISGAPGACPSAFSQQLDQKIVGLSDVISFPILFCDRSIYRVEGTYDSFGNNGYALREIHKTAGCVSNASIVKIPGGLVWFGNGAIWFTDGYTVQKLTKHLNISYQNWASPFTAGEYDPTKNIVLWTVNKYQSKTQNNDSWLALHLAYGLSEESVFSTLESENNFSPSAMRFSLASDIYNSDPTFTTTGTWTSGTASMVVASATGLVAGMTVTGVGIPYGTTISSIASTTVTLSKNTNQVGSATSVTFTKKLYSPFYNRMLFTDQYSYLLWFDPSSFTDVLINNALAPSAMVKKTIMYNRTTAGLDQGVAGFRKYTTDLSVEIDASTEVSMQVRSRRDDGGGWSGEGGTPPDGKGATGSPGGGSSGNPGIPEFKQGGPLIWNVSDCSWLDDPNEHHWDEFATVTGRRTIPAGTIRSGRRQLKFTNAFTIISNSDTLGTATVAPRTSTTPATITLDNASNLWISDPEGYWITFVDDSYVQTYQIIARLSDTVLQVTDPTVSLTAGSKKWEIKGFRKFERPRILNFTLMAEFEGATYGQSALPQGGNT